MAFEEMAISFMQSQYFLPLIVIISIWDLFFKGWALWEASGRKEKTWFIVLFILNTAGILPIIYLWLKKWSKIKHTSRKKIIRY
ncbi:MAG: hypothetical protein J4451_00515 [DPANN group archaeon]|nr:hypothetical protein [DPANN group archaeon]